MSRNRVIYQSEALYVSKEAHSDTAVLHEQIERVQSANYSFNISRQDINQYGHLAKLGSLILEAPTVSADFTYLATDGFNERALGFYVQTSISGASGEASFASGQMIETSGRNLFITTVGEGLDNTGVAFGVNTDVIGIGNAYLTDYTLDLAVGSLPTVSVSYEGANINVSAGTSIINPAVKQDTGLPISGEVLLPTATSGVSNEIALRPGDVTVDISSFDGITLSDLSGAAEAIHIQSASLSLPMSRTPLQRLGTKFSYARSIDFPVAATLSINAILNETQVNSLSDVISIEDDPKTVTLTLKNPAGGNALVYTMKGCNLVSESFSSSIGSNKSVDLTFETQIGGPSDTLNGVFVSGANISEVFTA